MYISKKWHTQNTDEVRVKSISRKFNISPITARIILNRGISTEQEISDYLNINLNQFLNPFDMLNMDAAVICIQKHIDANSKIAVYGDYDVDGITSTYIVYDYLKSLNVNVVYYIPNRSEEGYGLNMTAIDFLSNENVNLIITVDVGITAVSEVEYIKSKQMDVVITDHHTPTDTIPAADAVINPKLAQCQYQNKNLAGVGVAFKLVYALSECDKKIIDKYSPFASIGTIADMVPLTGENRFITSYGLSAIKSCQNVGLKALMKVSNTDINSIDSGNISFGIAPRLNAAGRIDSANISVDLFLTDDASKADEIAALLDEENRQRQIEEQKILEEALRIIENDKLYENEVIVVANKNWHHGIIGIVSSKITEKYYKPSAVISVNDDGSAKASGRSISGFNLFDSLSYCADFLTKFGGHELAAGFSLDEKNIDLFRKHINEYASGIMTDEIKTPKINIDAEISSSDITLDLVKELQILEPYGIGNRTPVFSIYDTDVDSIRYHKSGKHAFLSLSGNACGFESPAFNMADDIHIYSCGDRVNVAGILNINTYRDIENAQFIIKDIKPSEQTRIDVDNLRIIFKCIKNRIELNQAQIKIQELQNILRVKHDRHIGRERLKYALMIFEELKLLKTDIKYDNITLSKGEEYHGKCDIYKSSVFNSVVETP